MALYLLQPGLQPLGQFDCLDTDLANVLGGEVGTLDEASRTNSASEKAASDVLDGYVADEVDVGTPTASRPVLRIADTATETRKLFYLLDDGQAHYGTLFGELIGTPVGLATTTSSGGSLLGPHTAAGSGKVTAWDKPGLYAVSSDALHASLDPNTSGSPGGPGGLNDTPLPGDLLYREPTSGKLSVSTAAVAAADKIGMFVETSGSGSLVTTPGKLVGAAETFDRVKFQYLGATHNA